MHRLAQSSSVPDEREDAEAPELTGNAFDVRVTWPAVDHRGSQDRAPEPRRETEHGGLTSDEPRREFALILISGRGFRDRA